MTSPPPFGTLPKIHSFWYCHPSLSRKIHKLAKQLQQQTTDTCYQRCHSWKPLFDSVSSLFHSLSYLCLTQYRCTSFIIPRFYPKPSRWGDKWSWSHSSQCAQPWVWWRHLWYHHCSVLEPGDQLRQGHPGLDIYPDISGSQEKPKSSIVFRSTRVLSCTLRLVACGFEVSYCPTDNQP